MEFDFTGIKTNLEGIKNYLNANGVKLSDEDTNVIFHPPDKVPGGIVI